VKAKPFRLSAPKPPVPTEYDEQAALMEWAELAKRKYPELEWLHASNNGVRVTIGTAIKMKKAGMKAGVPDLNLPWPHGGYHGLWIEMKRQRGGRVDPDQTACHTYLRDAGYQVVVCKGWESAKAAILNYLQG
jgi:hypothetical protein